jgi:hypothetical protein
MHTSRPLLAALLVAPFLASRAQAPVTTTRSATRPLSIFVKAVRASLYHVQPTPEQQTKIKAIVAQQRPKLVAIRESMKPWPDKLKAAREQHDTAAARAARVELRRGRVAIAQVARQTLLDVQPLLSAIQQTQFDTNVRRMRPALVRFARGGRRPG